MERVILTEQNAHRAKTVRSITNPEWGDQVFRHNAQPLGGGSYCSIVGIGCNSSILPACEYHLWEIVEFRHSVTLDEFDMSARDAFRWTSFDPEGRGARTVADHEEQLNVDLEDMPEEEKGRYVEGYKRHFAAWLSAQSRCTSSAITGGAGFNVRRAEKANDSERKRYDEFTVWRDKALKAIAKRLEAFKPAEQVQEEAWNELRRELDFKLSHPHYMTAQSIYNVVATRAAHGNVEIVEKAIAYVREHNAASTRPIITERHKFFKLAEIAVQNRAKQAEMAERENGEITFPGGRVVQNWAENRLQIIFDEKPASDLITELKRHAFKWAPSKGAWQRQNTGNAVYTLKHFIIPLLRGENNK